MVKYQISVAREETEKVDTMRFAWQKLNTSAVSPMHETFRHKLKPCCVIRPPLHNTFGPGWLLYYR